MLNVNGRQLSFSVWVRRPWPEPVYFASLERALSALAPGSSLAIAEKQPGPKWSERWETIGEIWL